MEKEALKYLVELQPNEILEVNGQTWSTNPLSLVPVAQPRPLTIHKLSGLVTYLIDNFDEQPPVLIQIESPSKVSVLSTFNADKQRDVLIRAEALLPNIPFESFQGVENFNILLQSCFVENEDRSKVLQVVGNVREEEVLNFGDDGVSQQVTASAGVRVVEQVKVPNPVRLKPFRTFIEISQPECQFVFRMRKGPQAALFEADGGAWKLQAIASIKEYLETELSQQIEAKQVFIIA
ncbi:hypothetical protein FFV09_23075 [Saccharibacillus brassicae]|uniref:Uncharacterized protein n=1 Tax=Saccharibacillus brassicae TaxID=2583377 RepID=A0A4Y6V5J8_SACBS|nr:hypothetical protein FFV09_23075 [Saccharibacillus brassicae]